ncbi:MAG TPA: hypothetical protein VFZ14_07560 [Burkholderiales bacterium]|nr:hypothetical protein [Burkholderiales bacterium]
MLEGDVKGRTPLAKISLHVIPNTGTYGSALFGFHFYTWAFIGYGALVTYAGVMLVVGRFGDAPRSQLSGVAKLACWTLTALIGANALAVLAECGLGACPDNPTGWLWSK